MLTALVALMATVPLGWSHGPEAPCALEWCGERELRLPSHLLIDSCRLAEEVYKVEVMNKKLDVLQADCLDDPGTVGNSCWNGTACSCGDCSSLVECCIRSQQFVNFQFAIDPKLPCTVRILRSDLGVSFQRAVATLTAAVTKCRLNTQKALILGMSKEDAEVGLMILEEIRAFQRSSPRIVLGPKTKSLLSQRIRKELRPVVLGDPTRGERSPPLIVFPRKGHGLFHLLEAVEDMAIPESVTSVVDGDTSEETLWIYRREEGLSSEVQSEVEKEMETRMEGVRVTPEFDYDEPVPTQLVFPTTVSPPALPVISASTNLHGASHMGRHQIVNADSDPLDTVVEIEGDSVSGVAGVTAATEEPTIAPIPPTPEYRTDDVQEIKMEAAEEEEEEEAIDNDVDTRRAPDRKKTSGEAVVREEGTRRIAHRKFYSDGARIIQLDSSKYKKRFRGDLRRAPPRLTLTKEDQEILASIDMKGMGEGEKMVGISLPRPFPSLLSPATILPSPATRATGLEKFPYVIPDTEEYFKKGRELAKHAGLSSWWPMASLPSSFLPWSPPSPLPSPPPPSLSSGQLDIPFFGATKFAINPPPPSSLLIQPIVAPIDVPVERDFGLKQIASISLGGGSESSRVETEGGRTTEVRRAPPRLPSFADLGDIAEAARMIVERDGEIRRAPPRLPATKEEEEEREGKEHFNDKGNSHWAHKKGKTWRRTMKVIHTPDVLDAPLSSVLSSATMNTLREEQDLLGRTSPFLPPRALPPTTLPLPLLSSSNPLDSMRRRSSANCSQGVEYCALLSVCLMEAATKAPSLHAGDEECSQKLSWSATRVATEYGTCLLQTRCPFYDPSCHSPSLLPLLSHCSPRIFAPCNQLAACCPVASKCTQSMALSPAAFTLDAVCMGCAP